MGDIGFSQITVRVETLDRIRELAQKDRRSMSQTVAWLVEQEEQRREELARQRGQLLVAATS
jgi:uncharacterized protein YnzC (UPF0291/DUF896 family)